MPFLSEIAVAAHEGYIFWQLALTHQLHIKMLIFIILQISPDSILFGDLRFKRWMICFEFAVLNSVAKLIQFEPLQNPIQKRFIHML